MTNAAQQVVGPQVHRLRHVRGNEVTEPGVSQQAERRAWRIVSAVETMHKAGKITEGMWQAYDRFETEWEAAGAGQSIIARYGERAGSGGTPVAHMTSTAFEAAQRRDARRRLAIGKVEAALCSVGVPRLCRALMLAVSNECGLEAIGRAISPLKDRSQVIAIAGAALEDALWCLEQHYSRLYGQAQVAP